MDESEDYTEDDPVVHEVNVYLSQSLKNNLYLLQYPLRPAHLSYNTSGVVGARVKPRQQKMEIDMAIPTHGEHYSRSRGEQMARAVDCTSSEPCYKSGLLDSQTLVSDKAAQTTSQFVTAVLKDGELHLTPLQGILQLRPSLRHLEQADTVQHSHAAAASDGDTTATESEGEEAKPVQVKFARSGGGARGQQRKPTEPEEAWVPLVYHTIESKEATDERQLLFTGDEDHTDKFTVTSSDYLDMVCLAEASTESERPVGPMGVLSLTELQTLPLEQQVTKLLRNAVLIQFDRLCTLLGRSRLERAAVLELLQENALLVQGCWVASSSLVLSPDSRHLTTARDYILWCFTQSHIITRKDLASTLKITNVELKELLTPVAVLKSGGGWQFKLPPDVDFITRYSLVTKNQQDMWRRRHQELMSFLGVGTSPDAGLKQPPPDQAPQTGVDHHSTERQSDSTPSHGHAALDPSTFLVKQEGSSSSKQGPAALGDYCRHALGRHVLSLREVKEKLLLYRTSARQKDPLGVQSLSDDSLVEILLSVGAMEVQECKGKRLFAMVNVGDPEIDKYRNVVISLFKSSSFLRRKQFLEEYSRLYGHPANSKTLTAVLKDLCYSKGSLWHLTGTS